MKFLGVICCSLALLGCEKKLDYDQNSTVDVDIADTVSQQAQVKELFTDFTTVEWQDLIPKEDLEMILNPPDYILQIEDGSIEDQVGNSIKSAMNPEQAAKENYQQALSSVNIIEAMDGKNIRIPGFVVPVEFEGEQQIKSFFLVPYFGACLHMPPPPPNQIIYVETEQGFSLDVLYDAVWVSGKLSTELFEDQIATSAYTMKMEHIELYYPGE